MFFLDKTISFTILVKLMVSFKVTLDEKYGLVAEMMLKRAFDFPSSKRYFR